MKVAETYVQMKERHQKEVNEFPMMWAFNNDQFAQGMKKLAGVEEGDCLLNASNEFPAGSSVCDWAALACAVGGAEDSYTAYLHALEAYVKNKLGEDSSLGRATDYHRIALTVLALGGDPAAFSEDKFLH